MFPGDTIPYSMRLTERLLETLVSPLLLGLKLNAPNGKKVVEVTPIADGRDIHTGAHYTQPDIQDGIGVVPEGGIAEFRVAGDDTDYRVESIRRRKGKGGGTVFIDGKKAIDIQPTDQERTYVVPGTEVSVTYIPPIYPR